MLVRRPNGDRVAVLGNSGLWVRESNPVVGASSLLTDLISYWQMSEIANASRLDAVGSNDLANAGTVDREAGIVGFATQFTASESDYLNIASNSSLNVGDVSAAWWLWVYLTDTISADIVCKFMPAAPIDREYLIGFTNTAGTIRFRFLARLPDDSNNTTVTANTFGQLSTGQWYAIYCEHDADNNTIGISINNGTLDTASHVGGIRSGSAQFRVGARVNNTFFFSGRVDEFGFWKGRVLTAAERTELYNGGAGITYPFPGSEPADLYQKFSGNPVLT